ncbi:ATP-dependent DNA helicase RecG, partial [Candidatus Berkelbacteria bacterium RBG_13_40_8]
KPRKIASLGIGEDVIIKAKISQIHQARTRRRWMSIIEATLVDDSGQIKAIWFNQPFLMKIFRPGDEFLFAGKVNWDFKNKIKTLSVTQYETDPIILPVYPETEGLTSKYLRKLIKPLISQIDNYIFEYLSENVIQKEGLISEEEAIKKIHFPVKTSDIDQAKKRLAFDELFLIALRMQLIRTELSQENGPALRCEPKILQDFVKKLPFKLTNAQRKAAWEIICDLEKSTPMNRLLEGDVGSGKTVVAAMAVIVASQNKMQSVWLAPTEILANQHYQNVSFLLKPFNIKVGLLTSARKYANLQKEDLIIGTHALIQKDIQIPNLGLIVVDEQHRFGVKQRAHLRKQSDIIPHLLSMTATPIPRTLALSFYGDLDLSILDEMPKGRQKIVTKVIAPQNRSKAYQFIENQVKTGRQVFVICPLIEEKDRLNPPAGGNLFDMDRKSAVAEYEKLSKIIFPDLKIGLLHGKMKSKDKEKVMTDFKNGKIDILVSTAVVEVGIDIPNATVMMIESAERFGLAQLHQFRGRVGRGRHQSYCFLFSESWSDITKKRLDGMMSCDSGFELAEIDLQLRGPGELAGIRQSGLPDLKMASFRDIILVKKARKAAEDIIDSGLEKYPKLIEKLQEFETERHLE